MPSAQKANVLCNLSIDILILVARHLDVQSIAHLEQTCKTLNRFVVRHGWPYVIGHRMPSKILHGGKARQSAKEVARVDRAWVTRTFVADQCTLSASSETAAHPHGSRTHAGSRAETASPSVPFCQLLLLPHGLILLMRSELSYWTSVQLEEHEPISLDAAQRVSLVNPANLDVQWRSRRKRGMMADASALWDVCTSAQLDRAGHLLALGRVNGLVEVIEIQPGGGKDGHDRVRVNLAWYWRDLMSTDGIQSMTSCPDSGLLAICSKRGDVWLLSVARSRQRNSKRTLDVRPIHHWSVQTRIWSACFGGRVQGRSSASWLAIGTASAEGILLFALDPISHLPSLANTLSCNRISVYALKADVGRQVGDDHLFAGCYDGKLRLFNISKALERGEVGPARIMSDRFDSSAIYCLCLGVGQGGRQIAAGTARHGIVKIFDPTPALQAGRVVQRQTAKANDNAEEDAESEGWSIFAAHPSRSPTYALAGQHDRLFGVTDQKLWQIDLRLRRTGKPVRSTKDSQHVIRRLDESDGHDDNNGEGTLAYYLHRDMILATSRIPQS